MALLCADRIKTALRLRISWRLDMETLFCVQDSTRPSRTNQEACESERDRTLVLVLSLTHNIISTCTLLWAGLPLP